MITFIKSSFRNNIDQSDVKREVNKYGQVRGYRKIRSHGPALYFVKSQHKGSKYALSAHGIYKKDKRNIRKIIIIVLSLQFFSNILENFSCQNLKTSLTFRFQKVSPLKL